MEASPGAKCDVQGTGPTGSALLGLREGNDLGDLHREEDAARTAISELAQLEPLPGPLPSGSTDTRGPVSHHLGGATRKRPCLRASPRRPPPVHVPVQRRGHTSSDTLALSLVLQAFSVIAMFNVMKFSIAILPFSVKAMSEGNVSLRRMKV